MSKRQRKPVSRPRGAAATAAGTAGAEPGAPPLDRSAAAPDDFSPQSATGFAGSSREGESWEAPGAEAIEGVPPTHGERAPSGDGESAAETPDTPSTLAEAALRPLAPPQLGEGADEGGEPTGQNHLSGDLDHDPDGGRPDGSSANSDRSSDSPPAGPSRESLEAPDKRDGFPDDIEDSAGGYRPAGWEPSRADADADDAFRSPASTAPVVLPPDPEAVDHHKPLANYEPTRAGRPPRGRWEGEGSRNRRALAAAAVLALTVGLGWAAWELSSSDSDKVAPVTVVAPKGPATSPPGASTAAAPPGAAPASAGQAAKPGPRSLEAELDALKDRLATLEERAGREARDAGLRLDAAGERLDKIERVVREPARGTERLERADRERATALSSFAERLDRMERNLAARERTGAAPAASAPGAPPPAPPRNADTGTSTPPAAPVRVIETPAPSRPEPQQPQARTEPPPRPEPQSPPPRPEQATAPPRPTEPSSPSARPDPSSPSIRVIEALRSPRSESAPGRAEPPRSPNAARPADELDDADAPNAGPRRAPAVPEARPQDVARADQRPEGEEERPARQTSLVRGWSIREVSRGTALLQGPDGLYEASPGAPLPGVGRVESIERRGGVWVVMTTGGMIIARR